MPRFDRPAVAAYVMKYALRHNPIYPYLAFFRGDCTNFVSQAMLAGGWPMIHGSIHDTSAWWIREGDYEPGLLDTYLSPRFSNSWVAAGAFAEFLGDHSERVSPCGQGDLQVGDIVQMQSDEEVHHTMVVTSRWYDDVNVSYHSIPMLNKSLKEIQAKYGAKDKYLYWKVADHFPEYRASTGKQVLDVARFVAFPWRR